MTGHVDLDGSRAPARLELDAWIPGFRPFLDDPRHTVRVEGTLHVEGRITHRPVVGDLDLFPDSGRWAMRYTFDLTDDLGVPVTVTGVKVQRRWNPFAAWHDLTTLSLELRPSEAAGKAQGHRGRLRIPVLGVFRLMGSIRGDAFTHGKRVAAAARFVGYVARGTVRGIVG
jgi:hypothetical protein